MRNRLVILTLVLTAIATPSQAAPDGQRLLDLRDKLVGQRIRLGSHRIGTVEEITPDFLVLRRGNRVDHIALDQVKEVTLVREGGVRSGNIAIGVLGGGLAGTLLASGMQTNRVPVVAAGALLGGAFGAAGKQQGSEHLIDVDDYLVPHWDSRVLGRKVRVHTLEHADYVQGRVVLALDDELVVQRRDGSQVAIDRSSMSDVQVYSHSPGGSVLGVVLGASMGLFLGGIIGIALHPAHDDPGLQSLEALEGGFYGALIGSVGLGIAGSRMGHHWKSLPKESGALSNLSLAPVAPEGYGLTLSGSF